MNNERGSRSAFERYSRLVEVSNRYLRFDSADDALEQLSRSITRVDGCAQRFIVPGDLGTFEVHRAYFQREELVSQCDWIFTLSELNRLREEAASELGEERLVELEIDHTAGVLASE